MMYHDRQSQQVSDQPTMRVAVAKADPADTYVPQARSPALSKARTLALAQLGGIIACMLLETVLLTISLVPASHTVSLGWSANNGPFPDATAPLVTAVFYLTPFACGLLTRRWDVALFAATLPAWLSIGLFTIFSAPREGIFAFARGDQPGLLVGTFELFAALGGFGWIVRKVFTRQAESA